MGDAAGAGEARPTPRPNDLAWRPDEVVEELPLSGGDIAQARRVRLVDGRQYFVKRYPGPHGAEMAQVEAAGIGWLRHATGGPPLPEVVAVRGPELALQWVDEGPVTPAPTRRLGTALAALHLAGAPHFGGPPGWERGFIGSVPVDNRPCRSWAEFWAEQRVRPLARRCAATGRIGPSDLALLHSLADGAAEIMGPPEPPARVHGDLWQGNVLHDRAGRAWLIDPAAHGGHREADLAMLALFGGLPTTLLDAYEEVAPLAEGWRERVRLHQIVPLLIHTLLFGGSYTTRLVGAARRYVPRGG